MSDLDITDSVLAELRSAADIVQIVGEHTRLKKAGRSWKGLCPFHNERTPSFTVDREKGLFHCFGCGAGGDVIHFVRQMDRLDFPEAVEALASRFGVTIPRRAFRRPQEDRKEKILEAVSAAHRFFMAELAKPGNKAAAYLTERGVAPEMSRRLGLGYAPDSWDSLSRALTPGYAENLLLEAGLLTPRPEGKTGSYDRFRDRLIFVVRDERGRPVGFGGRVLAKDAEPKYLNSPETPVFQKKRLLYGLSEGRDAIRKHERVILVEGYFDHLALAAAGIEETVASMGTALTPEQATRLKRMAPRIVVCYDGDSAGRAATRTALEHLLAQGLSARVVRLPSGLDPHDVLRQQGAASLAARVEEAPDYLAWLLEDANPLEAGLDSAQKSSRISAIVALIAQIPDTILRHEECRRVARHSGVPMELLWDKIKPVGTGRLTAARPPLGTPTRPPVLSDGGIPQAEHALLSLLVRGEELIPLILRTLKDEWLTHDTVRKIVGAFRYSGNTAEPIDFQRQIAQLREDSDISVLARAAAEEGPEPSPTRVAQVLRALEEAYLKRRGDSLQDEIQRAETENRPREEVERLSREKHEIGRRIQELKPSRKGKALVD
ncbi:MAG TPA: DNA primase [Thermoanaerobaculia bacterium]|jgi:DNA primase|nr:DNA primase [Thermoanaerobaculia bacterium]